ncbi:hypothetical protein [Streptomyces katsurahamanus]|uniref:hypothetical protein n=1 Tax=Streptomyces katsurahamanus TaxID=2577098 RepID=UPI001E4C7C39|nr:hypothetical protein [Streptomyces katsurahamanus]
MPPSTSTGEEEAEEDEDEEEEEEAEAINGFVMMISQPAVRGADDGCSSHVDV